MEEAWQLLEHTALEWWSDNTLRPAASLVFYTNFLPGAGYS
jgi:hypothetical protein